MASRASRDMAACMKTGGKLSIKKAIKKPGQLHKDLGVPQGKKIPEAKMKAAAKKPGKVGQRARFAETLKGFAKGGKVHDDVAMDRAMVKKMVKPAALTGKKSGGVAKFAVGGAAKSRLGMASESGKQVRVTAPVKSQKAAPKGAKRSGAMI